MPTLQQRFFQWVSGERRGPKAALARAALRALSLPYRLAVQARLALYACGILVSYELEAHVISVGNLTTGGTGKTPLVIWLARWLMQRGHSLAILSRGYGATAPGGSESDETLLFRRYLPTVPHLVGKDRRATGQRAIAEHDVECILLDDAFQHLGVGRDLNLVVIDCLLPFGYGRLLPRGLLREPLSGLRRADLVVLSRCDLCPREAVDDIKRRVRDLCGPRPIVESAHRPVRFYRHQTEESRPLGWVDGRRVWAFSALGNPAVFPKTLGALGAAILDHQAFRDHHWYSEADLEAIGHQAAEAGAEAVVTTEKDAVKIRAFPRQAPPLYVLAVELALTEGEQTLVQALTDLVQSPTRGAPPKRHG